MAEDILGSKLYVLFVVLSTLGISYEQYPKIPLREFESILIQHKIIPDVLRTVPKFPLEVKFKDKHVTLGNTLTKEDCVDPPNITWPYMEDRVYSIAFTDIDEPGFTPGYPREWQHWLVGNIPENNMKIAEVLTEYLGLFDFHLRKRHRYCIYLFQHLSLQYMKFEELHISGPMDQLRRGFGALRFAHEYQLEIIAMNFFYAGSDTKPAKYPELSTESLAERQYCDNESRIFVTESFNPLQDVKRMFEDNGIVPDILSQAPAKEIKIAYPDNVTVNFGNYLTEQQIRLSPKKLSWEADPEKNYTMLLTAPDVPTRKLPVQREWLHWMIGNIPGDYWGSGETLAEYMPPYTGRDTRRFVFLVFEHEHPVDYENLNRGGSTLRVLFSTMDFAKEHKLGHPVAGNFFQMKEED